jgi:hypothetical protein
MSCSLKWVLLLLQLFILLFEIYRRQIKGGTISANQLVFHALHLERAAPARSDPTA